MVAKLLINGETDNLLPFSLSCASIIYKKKLEVLSCLVRVISSFAEASYGVGEMSSICVGVVAVAAVAQARFHLSRRLLSTTLTLLMAISALAHMGVIWKSVTA